MRRVEVHQLRAIAEHQFLELVEVGALNVPSGEPRTGRAEGTDRAEISGAIDDDGVARIDEAPREQVQSLLRAGEDEDVLRRAAEAFGERGAETWLSFGRPELEGLRGVA